jgi:Putative beta-barrel porin-2, OmpL-like. bbp2
MLANVNGNIANQGERAPALVYRVDYSRGEFNGWGFAGLHGKTTNFNTGTKTTAHLFEVDGYFIRGDWTVQGQLGLGQQKAGGITPTGFDANGDPVFPDAKWTALSGLVGYNLTPRLQVLARADKIRNSKGGGGLFTYTGYWDAFGVDGPYGDYRNGIGPDPTLGCDVDPTAAGCDKGADRYALSLGMKYAFNTHTTFKLEYRRDGANIPVFFDVKSGTYRKTNDLLGASVVVAF